MRLTNLDDWRTYCAEASSGKQPSTDSMWHDLGKQPPPLVEDATCRIPIIRAAEYLDRAEKAKRQPTKVKHLHTALEWLDCPHPWSFASTLRETNQLKAMLKLLLKEVER